MIAWSPIQQSFDSFYFKCSECSKIPLPKVHILISFCALLTIHDGSPLPFRETVLYCRSRKNLTGLVLNNVQVFGNCENILTYAKIFDHHCGISFSDVRMNDVSEDLHASSFLHGASLNTCLCYVSFAKFLYGTLPHCSLSRQKQQIFLK